MTPHQFTSSSGAARSRRANFVQWLRKTHGWIGLWGAGLFLLFGATAILLNHRAVMKIPATQVQESTLQLPVPRPAPANALAMSAWLRQQLALGSAVTRIHSEPSAPAAWGDKAVMQPEHWSATFASPKTNVQMDYWVGNNFVSVKRNENNLFGTLNNLHKGTGVGAGWILLVDTLAVSLILLPLTGVVLWAMVNRRRMVGTGIAVVSIASAILFALQAM
ncbi:MAG TPA: PepSY-associated TM helix domain-containing protein [Janthinobacterium sp.]|nr:PepSY-associated TM helix domain-containing protein [Janthinobacterium sp.]